MGIFGAGLDAVDGGFDAPFGGEETDALVDGLIEAEKVATARRSRRARLGSVTAC